MMQTVKTSELSGAALDWAVAKCEEPIGGYKAWVQDDLDKGILHGMSYSSNWSFGGPIIESGCIGIDTNPCGSAESHFAWKAIIDVPDCDVVEMHGDKPLVAAMRCYVASKFGDEMEIPAVLLS